LAQARKDSGAEAECAGVVKADALAAAPKAWPVRWPTRLQDLFRRHPRGSGRGPRGGAGGPRSITLDGFFQNTGDTYARLDCKPVIGDLNELGRMGRVLPPPAGPAGRPSTSTPA